MAFQYAKLWSDDFDWHDVLREPGPMFFVVAEWTSALSGTEQGAEVRQNRSQGASRASST
jgi:hypothetical protein